MMGLAVGLMAGVAAGLLAAPMRGTEMRASLRSRADEALDRGMMLLEQGRRAFSRGETPASAGSAPLTATLGDLAQLHSGNPGSLEGRS